MTRLRWTILALLVLLLAGCGGAAPNSYGTDKFNALEPAFRTVTGLSRQVASDQADLRRPVLQANRPAVTRLARRLGPMAQRLESVGHSLCARLRTLRRQFDGPAASYVSLSATTVCSLWNEGGQLRYEAALLQRDPMVLVGNNPIRLRRINRAAAWFARRATTASIAAHGVRRHHPNDF